MHRYREFGLFSEQDEVLRRAFRDGFKRAGLSFAQFLDALSWYRDHARPAADEAQLADAFAQFAADSGWPEQQRDGILDLYRTIRDDGPAAVMQPPAPDEDRATLARADDLLRRDPARYWHDMELQDAAFEARERLDAAQADGAARADGAAPASPAKASPDQQRIQEIEAMLHHPSGDGQRRYWTDAALRADYAQALGRLYRSPGSGIAETTASSPAAPENVGAARS
jgi:DNA-binding transcriptional MerR regulator